MKKICLAFFLEAILLGAVILVWFSLFGSTPESYPDVIVEWTAFTGNHKSMEMHLVWVLVALTLILTGGLYGLLGREQTFLSLSNHFFRKENYIATAFVAYVVVFFFIYHRWIILFCCAAVLAVIVVLWKKENVLESVIGFFSAYYALFGLAAFIEWMLPYRLSIGTNTLIILSFLLALGVLKAWPHALKTCILYAQLLIPLGFFAFLYNIYVYQDQIYTIRDPWQAVGFIVIVVGLGLYFGYRKYRGACRIDRNVSLDEGISIWTCITIYVMNQYASKGLNSLPDLHHLIENVLGFSQIFELGQIPFLEYMPVSGFYSVVHGAFLYVFGNDSLSNYGLASNILLVCIGGVTIFLLHRLINNCYVFLFALFFNMNAYYDRVWLILPVILLILQPEILNKPMKMMMTWLLSSCFLGLYYPLYGAAVCMGFVPVVVYHVWVWKTARISFAWKRKTLLSWVGMGCLLLLAGPLLYGMAMHMLAMSSQTIWADGIGAFGQDLPDWFLKPIPWWTVRLAFYDVVRFLFPMVPTAVGTWLLCGMFREYRSMKKLQLDRLALATLMITVTVVSFSYTFVRLDYGALFARSTSVLFIATGLFFLYIMRHADAPARKLCLVMTAACVAFMGQAPDRAAGSLRNFTSVQNDFVYVDHDFPHIGEGFLLPAYNEELQTYGAYARSGIPMFALPHFAEWYVLDIPGVSTLEAATIRGYAAAEESIQILKKQKPVIGTDIDSYGNYYLYHWVVTSGNYQYSAKDKLFYPEQLQERGNQDISLPGNTEARNLLNAPAATGLSMKSLRKNFSDVSVNYDVTLTNEAAFLGLHEAIDGDQSDFLYLELELEQPFSQYGLSPKEGECLFLTPHGPYGKYLMMKLDNPGRMLKVLWTDDAGRQHFFQMNFGQGKLLIPLGAGNGWLLNHHDRIELECMEGEKAIPIKVVGHIEFLKLRMVE
ncbi:MAG: hypothetical protein MR630_02025 [Selenomonas sp.]|uniref:hypothetical protein n=1 Tax=Selenomonas sp. TaxID=2053611 RepID=UPI0025EF9E91|nr:hypothetical protein [Selenomonas sp.]MCI6231391.1 hypothetical protein [Selenomonas sp.]